MTIVHENDFGIVPLNNMSLYFKDEQVDRLHQAFMEAGAMSCREPEDTWMYEPK